MAGLGAFFALGVKGFGGVLSIRLRTSSSLGVLGMDDLTSEETMSLYTAVGAVIINWGIAENCISHACDVLVSAGGHKSQRLPPKEISRRLKLIKACCKDYPELAHMRAAATHLITGTKQLTAQRDIIVHGALNGFDREKLHFKFVRIDAGKHDYSMSGYAFPVATLLKLSETAAKIGADWIKFVDELYRIRDSENGLKYADRVWHVSVRIWAYGVYKRVQRLISGG